MDHREHDQIIQQQLTLIERQQALIERLHLHISSTDEPAIHRHIHTILDGIQHIMSVTTETSQALDNALAHIGKTSAEIDALKVLSAAQTAAIAELTATIATLQVSAEESAALLAKAQAVEEATAAVDAKLEDIAPTPSPEPQPEPAQVDPAPVDPEAPAV